ncbi:hypothetical protein, partial [Streptomyces hainanensis]|uniref:hypothetical protein n=1 Tax=Streptomyces hainanensis TaxID=402648 RepID=UPI001A9E7D6D
AEPAEPADPTDPAEPTDAAEPRVADTGTVLRIGDWSRPVVRGGQDAVDRCREAVLFAGPDPGAEDGYELRTMVIVGHDYCGFAEFATLPVGTEVTLTGPFGELRYEVYGHHVTPGQGGPDHGLYWGDLTLQACVGQDTGFSYLRRV